MNFLHRFTIACFSLLYPSKIHGRENIPDGGAVLVCNHFRAIDCGFVARTYRKKDIYFLAKQELFKNKLFAGIIKGYGAIPINREKPDPRQLLATMRILKENHKLVIFPEGTRNKTGTDVLQEIKGGPAIFAIKTKKPIVPMMLSGKAKIFRKTHILIGEPFELTEYYGKKLTDEDIEEIDKIIYDKMVNEQVKLKEMLSSKKKKKKKNK